MMTIIVMIIITPSASPLFLYEKTTQMKWGRATDNNYDYKNIENNKNNNDKYYDNESIIRITPR